MASGDGAWKVGECKGPLGTRGALSNNPERHVFLDPSHRSTNPGPGGSSSEGPVGAQRGGALARRARPPGPGLASQPVLSAGPRSRPRETSSSRARLRPSSLRLSYFASDSEGRAGDRRVMNDVCLPAARAGATPTRLGQRVFTLPGARTRRLGAPGEEGGPAPAASLSARPCRSGTDCGDAGIYLCVFLAPIAHPVLGGSTPADRKAGPGATPAQ